MTDAPTSLPAWKRRPQTAGAMLLLKGYVPTVTSCDFCTLPLEREDRTILVTFHNRSALYPCPHCHGVSERTLVRRRAADAGA